MTKSQLFKNAHALTRKAELKAILLGQDFNYQITFSFYLKNGYKAQPINTIDFTAKKINKGVAMIGDYKKPSIFQTFIATILVMIQNILDSEPALRIRLPETFAYWDKKSADRQKEINDINNKINL